MTLRDRDGRTASAAAAELFEYEDCDDCGQGAENHDGLLVLGNWFHRCREVAEDSEDLRTRHAVREWERARCPIEGHGDHAPGATY